MRRLFRCYRVPLWVMAIMLVAATVFATGWSAAHQRRMEHRDFYLNRIEQQAQMMTGLMSANAIMMGSWQWEARKAGTLENQRNVANGRLGPMQQQINKLERELEACAGSGDEPRQ